MKLESISSPLVLIQSLVGPLLLVVIFQVFVTSRKLIFQFLRCILYQLKGYVMPVISWFHPESPQGTLVMKNKLLLIIFLFLFRSYMELQKAMNQGRRCTWEKLAAIKANCGIELALDESVAILNHRRTLERSAERAAASSHGISSTVKFNAPKRIPSWNCLARENSTGCLEEDTLSDVSSSSNQGVGGNTGGSSARNFRVKHNMNGESESESERVDLNPWTRSGGPLISTTSANNGPAIGSILLGLDFPL